ncbi:MAG TPA: enoyl-CoA hydratase/isomerase family protein, partial [Acidimicrobiia bacterium]
MSLVRYETDGAVAVITLDRPPVNALSAELIADLATATGRAADASVRAVVITGAPHFAAGADIAAFVDAGAGGSRVGIELGLALRRIEALPKPVIAA